MRSFAEWMRVRRERKDGEHQQWCWYGLDEDRQPARLFWFAIGAGAMLALAQYASWMSQ